MKKFFFLIIFILSFQSLLLAENIKRFSIEGMKIGDSALDYFNESKLEHNEQGWHNYSYNEYSTSYMQGKGIYDWFLVSYKNNDKYIIDGLVGGLEKINYDNKECNNKIDIVSLNISKLFKNTTQEVKKFYELKEDSAQTYPFAGKSTVTSLSFNFLDGAKIILACYKIDKRSQKNKSFLKSVLKQRDSFRIDLRSSAFANYLKKKEK